MLLLPEMVPDVGTAGACGRCRVMFGTWLGFFLEAALREGHLPPFPGTWSVNGSRMWFWEEVSQEAGTGEKLNPL